MSWFKKQKKQLNLLEMVPYHLITNYSENENLITLLLPKFKSPVMAKWLLPGEKSKFMQVKLDANGSRVWKLIDGKINVQELCDVLRALSPEEQQLPDLEERTAKFISQLYTSRFIKFKEEKLCL